MCRKRVPDGRCRNWKTPSAELSSGARDQHVAVVALKSAAGLRCIITALLSFKVKCQWMMLHIIMTFIRHLAGFLLWNKQPQSLTLSSAIQKSYEKCLQGGIIWLTLSWACMIGWIAAKIICLIIFGHMRAVIIVYKSIIFPIDNEISYRCEMRTYWSLFVVYLFIIIMECCTEGKACHPVGQKSQLLGDN